MFCDEAIYEWDVGAYKLFTDESVGMEGSDVIDTIEEEFETELSRLGSSKALYAISRGEMDTDVVLGVLSARAVETASILEEWSTDEEAGEASELFDSIAQEIRAYAGELEAMASNGDDAGSTAFHDYLTAVDSTPGRLGAFVGWLFVSDQSYLQGVGFFVGSQQGDAADLLRDARSDIEAFEERTVAVIDGVCTSDDAYNEVVEAASGLVEAAYDEYVESLESMGIDVKPIC